MVAAWMGEQVDAYKWVNQRKGGWVEGGYISLPHSLLFFILQWWPLGNK